ncbi:SLC2A8 [Cordylochernes scorpioides]|uniref:SLC2A8 n=1 Tax=Cordylochernes scorpioides TaxID=51811 RepID=A0ABY6KSX9_9ARAC|nr:SLC2A8 [Cordylochernes scorpioides]
MAKDWTKVLNEKFGTACGKISHSVLLSEDGNNAVTETSHTIYLFGFVLITLCLERHLNAEPKCSLGRDVLLPESFITERYGRRSAIIIFNVPFVIGWLNIAFAYNIPQLFIARYLTGLCCGAMSLAVPVYLAEIAPPHLRGLLGSGMQLSVTVGVLLVYAVGVALPWSWLAYHCCIYSGASMLMLTFCPETPRWLISRHRQEEALQAIRFLSGTQVNPEAECQAIEVSLLQQPAGKASIKEILLPQNWKPLLLSLFLMLFQQANGNNNVIQNAVKIFKDCPDLLDPNLSSIVLAVVMVVATFIATVVVDLAGRRFLLIISGLGNFLTLAALGTYYYLSQVVDPSYHTSLSWLPLVSAAGFLIIFSIGFGPVPWLMMSELFPLRMRGLFSGIATAFNWTCVFIVTKEFEDTRQGLHDYDSVLLSEDGNNVVTETSDSVLLSEDGNSVVTEMSDSVLLSEDGNNAVTETSDSVLLSEDGNSVVTETSDSVLLSKDGNSVVTETSDSVPLSEDGSNAVTEPSYSVLLSEDEKELINNISRLILDESEDSEEEFGLSDEDSDNCYESNHNSESEQDVISSGSEDEGEEYLGKNGHVWSSKEPIKTRTKSSNIVVRCPGPKASLQIPKASDAFNLYFDDNTINVITKWTNQKIDTVKGKAEKNEEKMIN